jgi:hypothetical protein
MVTGFKHGTSVAPTSQASVSVMFLLPVVNFAPNFIKINQQFLRQNMIMDSHTESPQYVLFYEYHEKNL